MNWFVTVYAALLFFLLTPAILLRLPPNGSKYTVAIVHALVFALIFHFTHKLVWQFSMSFEGFVEGRRGGSSFRPPTVNCGDDFYKNSKACKDAANTVTNAVNNVFLSRK